MIKTTSDEQHMPYVIVVIGVNYIQSKQNNIVTINSTFSTQPKKKKKKKRKKANYYKRVEHWV